MALRRDVAEGTHLKNACIVDKNVDCKLALGHRTEQCLGGARRGEIGGMGDGLDAMFRFERLAESFELVETARDQHEVETAGRELARQGRTDASRCPRNEYRLAHRRGFFPGCHDIPLFPTSIARIGARTASHPIEGRIRPSTPAPALPDGRQPKRRVNNRRSCAFSHIGSSQMRPIGSQLCPTHCA